MFIFSGSTSILASLMDSLADATVSVMTFFAVRFSLKPADTNHRSGHGKIEGLAALFQSLLIAAAACGFRKVAARQGYFSFSGKHHMTGQAPIVNGLTEEMRLFIGQEPKGIDQALYTRDSKKIGKLAAEYSALLGRELGAPRLCTKSACAR